MPEVPSPLFHRGKLYLIRNGSILTCLDVKTGKAVFPGQRLQGGSLYYSSPVAGDGKIYFASDSGMVTVMTAGNRFEVLGHYDLGESIRAIPALLKGTIYLRASQYLYAFGS